jgi:hypothetical protein
MNMYNFYVLIKKSEESEEETVLLKVNLLANSHAL